MSDFISQEEIDALLNASSVDSIPQPNTSQSSQGAPILTLQEKDAIGEVSNICIGNSATTLSQVLGRRVSITTPSIEILNLEQLLADTSRQEFVSVRIDYIEGVQGTNFLLLKNSDVMIITDLMMGNDGSSADTEINELHLSAAGEAMNQMMGTSATSMAQLLNRKIDISPPKAEIFEKEYLEKVFRDELGQQAVVQVSFRLEIEELVDSELMQLLPVALAKELVSSLLAAGDYGVVEQEEPGIDELSKFSASLDQKPKSAPSAPTNQMPAAPPLPEAVIPDMHSVMQPAMAAAPYPMQQMLQYPQYPQGYMPPHMAYGPPQGGFGPPGHEQHNSTHEHRVDVNPANFQNFDDSKIYLDKKNVDIVMDVPLQVTVELGRTKRLIKDIIGFGMGTIIELDKLAGEPVDILVNGKHVAKGEVVVVDESFGVRITEIVAQYSVT